MSMTASVLLALSHGVEDAGESRCYFCGAACDGEPVGGYIKDTFTGYHSVAAPGSGRICKGCVLAMRSECEVDMVDGSRFAITRGGLRLFSWILTRDGALAASKAHMDLLRVACLSPPSPPYAIVLSDSGQTHQIYRGVVGLSRESAVVTLEAERIDYRPADLASALGVAGRIAAAAGKPSLSSRRLPVSLAARVVERRRDGEADLESWASLGRTPLCRLAAWLCPKKEDCERAHPADVD